MTERVELVQNAAGRMVPAMVNGKPQIPYLGVAKYQPRGRKAAPPVRSSKDYPDNGDKRVPDLETALRKCGLRDGMVISNHHHLRDGDRVAADDAGGCGKNRRQRPALVSQCVVSLAEVGDRTHAVGRDPSH